MDVTHWLKLVDIVQVSFHNGQISKEVTHQSVVLMAKSSRHLCVIVLMEVISKMVAVIIDNQLGKDLEFHDVMRSFRVNRGTGISYLKAKLLQQMMTII